MDFSAFFLFLNSVKTFHWLTSSHAHHIVLDEAYNNFSDKIDEFVESAIGMNNPSEFKPVKVSFMEAATEDELPYLFEKIYDDFISQIRKYATTQALESLIDDMDNIANKTIYLLRMN